LEHLALVCTALEKLQLFHSQAEEFRAVGQA